MQRRLVTHHTVYSATKQGTWYQQKPYNVLGWLRRTLEGVMSAFTQLNTVLSINIEMLGLKGHCFPLRSQDVMAGIICSQCN